MSVGTISRSGLRGSKHRRLRSSTWTRPADWLSLPDVAVGEQKIVGLHAVYDHDSNYVTLSAAGAYTVDWGDGSAPQNFATAATASHLYSYSAISAATESTRGYRQVIITITPQAGQNLTSVSFNVKHAALVAGYSSGWLDIRMAAANLTSINLSALGTTVFHRVLERFEYVGPSSIITAIPGLFYQCSKLQALVGTAWTAGVTGMSNMFQGCDMLKTIPPLDTGNCTTFATMFNACRSLESVPLLNTSKVTTFSAAFQSCVKLKTLPLFDTSKVTNFSTAFNGCLALEKIPAFVTSAVTTMVSAFSNSGLRSVPLLDTSKVVNFSSMFSGCPWLEEVPAFDTSLGTDFSSMFANCAILKTIPLFNTAAGTNFAQMFDSCPALQSVPLLNVAACTSAANFNLIFRNCFTLAKGALAGARFAISYASCRMSDTELNRVYTNLGVASGAQAVTVTGNPGIATDDPTIATAKGWTVTGS